LYFTRCRRLYAGDKYPVIPISRITKHHLFYSSFPYINVQQSRQFHLLFHRHLLKCSPRKPSIFPCLNSLSSRRQSTNDPLPYRSSLNDPVPSIPGTPSLHLYSTTLGRNARTTTNVVQSNHRSMWLGRQSLSTIQSHDTASRKTEEPSLHITRVTLLWSDTLSITTLHTRAIGGAHYSCCWEEVSAPFDMTLVQPRTLEVGYLAILE
jgi:hypothetical protein